MVQVQVEVESGAGRFLVSVRAASIGRALSLVGAGTPGVKARVVLPTRPEPLPVREAPAPERVGSLEPVESAA